MISVVIPTRHRNEMLARCLERLAPGVQTLSADDYEVIVTDDGEKSTAEIMIANHFPWAGWTAGPRRGPGANRNHGSSSCKGEWLAFIDDDCVPDCSWLSEYAGALKRGGWLFEGRTECRAGLKHFYQDAPVNLSGGPLPSCNMMICRELFQSVDGFDERFPFAMEDVDLRERLRSLGHTAIFLPHASVDHPPRRRVVGAAAGRLWEGRTYYEIKWGRHRKTAPWMPTFLAKVRLAEARNLHRLKDLPFALSSLLGEWWYVWRNVVEWDVRYADQFNTVNSSKGGPTTSSEE